MVVGTSGSGKTTFASALARRLGTVHIELDALHWGPSWTPVEHAVLRTRVAAAVAGGAWVIDGNYGSVRDLIWSRADALVWLDYPLPLTVWRLVRRTLGRIRRQEELWGTGNREAFGKVFFGRDSLLVWALTSHGRHRREYPALLAGPHAHLQVHRFRSPRAADAWLRTLSPAPGVPTAPHPAAPGGRPQ